MLQSQEQKQKELALPQVKSQPQKPDAVAHSSSNSRKGKKCVVNMCKFYIIFYVRQKPETLQ